MRSNASRINVLPSVCPHTQRYSSVMIARIMPSSLLDFEPIHSVFSPLYFPNWNYFSFEGCVVWGFSLGFGSMIIRTLSACCALFLVSCGVPFVPFVENGDTASPVEISGAVILSASS